jgi:hypothetical protein
VLKKKKKDDDDDEDEDDDNTYLFICVQYISIVLQFSLGMFLVL